MGTELAKIAAPTPQIAKGLSQQELFAHRDQIYSEVMAVLGAYYQPSDPPEVRAINKAWWCDELQDWTHEQVVYALRQWNRDNPRLRPTPGDILRMLKRLRGMKEAQRMRTNAPAPEPEKERATPEQVNAILAEAGFSPKRMTD